MADAKKKREATIRAMHQGYSAYVRRSTEADAEWELWQAACEWAWKNPRRAPASTVPRGVSATGAKTK